MLIYPVTYLLNLFDLVATLNLVSRFGPDIEGNPIGRVILSMPYLLYVLKIFVVGLALLFLFVNRDKKAARYGGIVVLSAYSLLAAYHVFLLILL